MGDMALSSLSGESEEADVFLEWSRLLAVQKSNWLELACAINSHDGPVCSFIGNATSLLLDEYCEMVAK